MSLTSRSHRSVRFLSGRWSALLALAPGLALAACASVDDELEHVAKDWAMTIRASQVIPVYPLTEDLQPGDVFLVQIPIDRQQEIYRDRGFLPLDNHVARLHPDGYRHFYDRAFLPDFGTGLLPRSQQRPTNGKSWSAAPQSGFPSYSFSVRQGRGLDLAVPVQGVPVGLGLLGSTAADGSLSLQDARTLGVDTVSLHAQLTAWARENRAFLEHFGAEPPRNWLRVVGRVYLAGQVDVSLRSAAQQAGGVDVGAAGPLAMLSPEPPAPGQQAAAAQGYQQALASLNESIQEALTAVAGAGAGGSLRLTAASARSVSMSETFDPPLVFGYLGFDVAILAGGDLGPPIPTHANLQAELPPNVAPEVARALDLARPAITRRVHQVLQALAPHDDEARQRVADLDALAQLAPAQATMWRTSRDDVLVSFDWPDTSDPDDPPPQGYARFHDWRGKARLAHGVLDRLLTPPTIRVRTAAGVQTVERGSDEWQRLENARDALAASLRDPVIAARLQEASRAAWRTFYRLTGESEAAAERREDQR